MKFENTEVWGFEHALRAKGIELQSKGIYYKIGKNDLKLAQSLIKTDSEHRKFLRQIFVAVDITAPAYFMAELDTYKIGVIRNSSSFQHKGTSKRFEIDDFEVDDEIKEVLRMKHKELSEMFNIGQQQVSVIVRDVDSTSENRELFEHCWYWEQVLDALNSLRDKYLETKDYKYFRLIRQLLPQSYLYRSTITMNYENILNIYKQRCICPHKLNEWSGKDNPNVPNFKSWVESLPYAKELLCF